MLRRGNIGTVLGVGLLAEILVFAAVVQRIGFGPTVLLSVCISVLGIVMLRRSGSAAIASLRSMKDAPLTRETALVDGMLGGIGAALLIVPGFLSDLVGLFLLAPSGRQWLVRRLGVKADVGPRPRRPADGTIDLNAGDWTRLDTMRRP